MTELFRPAGAPGAVGEGEGELVGQRNGAAAAGLRDVRRSDATHGASSCSPRTCCTIGRIATPAGSSNCSRATTVACRCSPAARAVARKAGASLISILQPFNRLLVSWSGRGEAGQLTGAEFDGAMSRAAARSTGQRLLSERAAAEAVRASRQPSRRLRAVRARRSSRSRRETTRVRPLRLFEKRLLDALGYGLALDAMSRPASRSMPRAAYHYRLDRAGAHRRRRGRRR